MKGLITTAAKPRLWSEKMSTCHPRPWVLQATALWHAQSLGCCDENVQPIPCLKKSPVRIKRSAFSGGWMLYHRLMWYILRDKPMDSGRRDPLSHTYPRGVLLSILGGPCPARYRNFGGLGYYACSCSTRRVLPSSGIKYVCETFLSYQPPGARGTHTNDPCKPIHEELKDLGSNY